MLPRQPETQVAGVAAAALSVCRERDHALPRSRVAVHADQARTRIMRELRPV